MAMSCDRPDLLPLDEALRRLWEALPATTLPAVWASRDDPAADRASMDGAALRAAEGRAPRQILGTLFAGDDPSGFAVAPGTAVRIMTGAAMPPGADAIVPVEQLETTGNTASPLVDPKSGDHVNVRGVLARAGDLLLAEGTPINAARVALLAQEGLAIHPLCASGSAWPLPAMNSFRIQPLIRSAIPTDPCSWPSPELWVPRRSSAPPCLTIRSPWQPHCASRGTFASCSPPEE